LRVHIIAIGGSIMHSLAIQLKLQGHKVSGSDDIIYDPARSNLSKYDLLPQEEGWFPEKIGEEVDLVIIGKHAHQDNPEYLKANHLGLKIQSFPEFVFERSLDKKRIVIAGSHGKTTTTSILMDIFKSAGREYDYLVGAKLNNYDRSFKLTASSPYILIEGDEYPTSSFDTRPKFIHYKPHYTIITGIAWDHMNAFPTEKIYLQQFNNYLRDLDEGTKVVFNNEDERLKELVQHFKHIESIPYSCLDYEIRDGVFNLWYKNQSIPLKVMGRHNVQNISAAVTLCEHLNIKSEAISDALSDYLGASKRLEIVVKKDDRMGVFDFAHAPSKVKASIEAIKQTYSERRLIAVLELHTYSSLNKAFLKNYRACFDSADEIYIYFSARTLEIKRLPHLDSDIIRSEMGRKDIQVYTSSDELFSILAEKNYQNVNLLLMTSGAFGKIDPREKISELME
jgi:UDP-N-acetylmuramate: L-alanyl-gamma-D-glutamyl-meso-diaminopimelate ligase